MLTSKTVVQEHDYLTSIRSTKATIIITAKTNNDNNNYNDNNDNIIINNNSKNNRSLRSVRCRI